jgi:WXXGXW repeat (2 copies)
MSTSRNSSNHTALPLTGVALVLSAATLLGGCVTQVRVASPPPPAAYAEPGVDVEVRATEAPPPLPDYEQPPCPDDGYLWTPGYWAWGGGGYYWVPGTWVQPPRVGVLWTPAYWGFVGGVYAFHAGYWGPHVGFYGGVNYGYGYVGTGFVGGRWAGNSFAYNRSVNNVNVTNIHNTYNETVINNVTINKVSYNGGAGGVAAVPTSQERAASQEQHVAPTPLQHQHVQEAARNPVLAARANGGHPAIAATPKPAAFNAPGIVGARGAIARAPGAPTPGAQPNVTHAPPYAQPNVAHAPPNAQANVMHAPPNAQPNVAHAPPNATMHPQAESARPPAAKPPAAKPQPPKNEKHEPEGGKK